MAWSLAVNAAIADMVSGVPPFPNVVECLDRITAAADLAVVSGTPGEALRREWDEHQIDRYPAIIAGQELGKKTEHLSVLTAGKGYTGDRMLMIGDAPGDIKAARATGVMFYPVNPGHEEDSWQRLRGEALDRFLCRILRRRLRSRSHRRVREAASRDPALEALMFIWRSLPSESKCLREHPRWQRRIRSSTVAALPRPRFIVRITR